MWPQTSIYRNGRPQSGDPGVRWDRGYRPDPNRRSPISLETVRRCGIAERSVLLVAAVAQLTDGLDERVGIDVDQHDEVNVASRADGFDARRPSMSLRHQPADQHPASGRSR